MPLMARFALSMVVILVVPGMCQKVRLPSMVGLLLARALFGPHGLHVVPKNHEVGLFFADIGKLLLMFFAGLEIDMVRFRRAGTQASTASSISGFSLAQEVAKLKQQIGSRNQRIDRLGERVDRLQTLLSVAMPLLQRIARKTTGNRTYSRGLKDRATVGGTLRLINVRQSVCFPWRLSLPRKLGRP
jgi:Sodium/hydrogen exchanger family